MVVRMRHNRSQTRQRRSHHRLAARAVGQCGNCRAFKPPHLACPQCGFYRGRQAVPAAKLPAEKK